MNTRLPDSKYAARGLLPRIGYSTPREARITARSEREEDAAPRIRRRAFPRFKTTLIVDVLLAAQHDDPEERDCQNGTNDSNH
jgi:hypothetical protein